MKDVWLHVPMDAFGVMFPESKLGDAELCSAAAPKLLKGFYRSVVALVECGNRVIVDTVVHQRDSVEGFQALFEPFRTLYVAVRCPLMELERREAARGDRNLGLARAQFADVHAELEYDIEVDTSIIDAEGCAAFIIAQITS